MWDKCHIQLYVREYAAKIRSISSIVLYYHTQVNIVDDFLYRIKTFNLTQYVMLLTDIH